MGACLGNPLTTVSIHEEIENVPVNDFFHPKAEKRDTGEVPLLWYMKQKGEVDISVLIWRARAFRKTYIYCQRQVSKPKARG